MSYQNIPEELRKTLTLNEVPTNEMDFSGMHVRLAYNLLGLPCPDDPYTPVLDEVIDYYNQEVRDAIKTYLLTCINADSFKGSIGALVNEEQEKILRGEKAPLTVFREHKIRPKDVYRAIEKVHAPLKDVLNKDMGIGFMFHESNIMNNILLRLMKENIKGIPLHDSVICQRGQEARVKAIMEEEYLKYTGFPAKVKPKRPIE